MRLQPHTITLGEHAWRVRPLTLAQVQAIEPLLATAGQDVGSVAAAIAIVTVALGRDHPEAAATLADVEAGAPEIAAAMAAVLRLGGFLPTEAAAPGEAPADQPDASTGPRSTRG